MSSYHGWTHAPKAQGGTDPIPGQATGAAPWIVLHGGSTTAPDATLMPIPFEGIAYDPALVTQGDIFDWSITDSGDTGVDRYVVETIPEGWFEYELVTQWDQVTTPGNTEHGLAMMRIDWNPGLNSIFQDNTHSFSADWNDADQAPGFFEMYDNPYLRGSGRVFVGPASGGGAQLPREWLLRAMQRTGMSRGLAGTYFLLRFVDADDSAGWTLDFV